MNRKVVVSAVAAALLGSAALLAQAQQGGPPLPTCDSCGVSEVSHEVVEPGVVRAATAVDEPDPVRLARTRLDKMRGIN
jgi:hypothetical protein